MAYRHHVDAALVGLVGVALGALLSAAIGSVLSHQRWVREVSLDAYTAYLTAAAQVALTASTETAKEHAEGITAARSKAYIVAPKSMAKIVEDLGLTAIKAYEDPSNDEALTAFTNAESAFTRSAHDDVMRWRLRRR